MLVLVYFHTCIGYDAGGLTREWISVLSTALFDPKNELFTQFNKDDKQALVRTISDFPTFFIFLCLWIMDM